MKIHALFRAHCTGPQAAQSAPHQTTSSPELPEAPSAQRMEQAKALLGTSGKQVHRLFQSEPETRSGGASPWPSHLLGALGPDALQKLARTGFFGPAGLSQVGLLDELFHQRVALRLEDEGFKTYGTKGRLKEYLDVLRGVSHLSHSPQLDGALRGSIATWLQGHRLRTSELDAIVQECKAALQRLPAGHQGTASLEQLRDIFDAQGFFRVLQTLEVQKRNGQGYRSVLKPFDMNRESRPGWPLSYKALLQVGPHDNIRHVVRNATLKRALARMDDALIQAGHRPSARNQLWKALAGQLNVDVDARDTVDVTLRKIYKSLFLETSNLFAGDGATNQLIGLLADPLIKFGEQIRNSSSQSLSISQVFDVLQEDIRKTALRCRSSSQTKQLAWAYTASAIEQFKHSLLARNQGQDQLSKDVLGAEIINLGHNFGFDLLDGRAPRDQIGIAERQGRLLRVEAALQNFQPDQGIDRLTEIFREFLRLA